LIISCKGPTPSSEPSSHQKVADDPSQPSAKEDESVQLPEMIFSESPYRDQPFACDPSKRSYVHTKTDLDTYYEEGWGYTLQFNFDERTFEITHTAGSERHYPEKCYSIYRWQGLGGGEVLDTYSFKGELDLQLELTRGCEALGDSPASEEIIIENYEWWIIGKIIPGGELENLDKDGVATVRLDYKLITCTCNFNAHQYTDAEFERFLKESICPPCIPGEMACVLMASE
jgi:hypothetical protein